MMPRLSGILKAYSRRVQAVFGQRNMPRVAPNTTPPFSEESITRYCPGGYHPVHLQDVFNNRYLIVRKLGYGRYSTVWLVHDMKENKHVALKILTADCFGTSKDIFELDILTHINGCTKASEPQSSGSTHILRLLDEFKIQGPNGTHACLVFKAMGLDMSHYRRLFPGYRIPHPILKNITRQLLLSLTFLHDTCHVIHTDIKPQNILLETPELDKLFEKAPSDVFKPTHAPCPPPKDFYMESAQITSAAEDLTRPQNLSVKLCDYGTASWYDKHLTEWIQPEKLRAPEVILGAQWDHKVDIWNLGVIIWELAEAQYLFDGRQTPNASYTAEAHLAQISAIFGPIPKDLIHRSSRASKYFGPEGQPLNPSPFPPCTLDGFCKSLQSGSPERRRFLAFMESMLRVAPEERLDARALLDSEWLTVE